MNQTRKRASSPYSLGSRTGLLTANTSAPSMSAAGRSGSSAHPRLSVARNSQTDRTATAQLVNAPSKSALHLLFQKALTGILGLLPENEGFVALGLPGREPQMEVTSPGFNSLTQQRLSWTRAPLQELLVHPEKTLTTRTELLQHQWPKLSLDDGEIALTCVRFHDGSAAVIGLFQPQAVGPINEGVLSALRAQADLLGSAVTNLETEQNVQVQQLSIEHMRRELLQAQLFFQQFSATVSQCFWVLDTEARKVVLISENFERVWGTNRSCLNEGLAGFVSTVFPGDRDWVLSQFHLRFGEDLDLEFRVIDEAGELRWIWLRSFISEDAGADGPSTVAPMQSAASSLGNGFGYNSRLVLIADDVTERKEESERMRSAEALLASRAKMTAVGELASGVAHEINNPLTVIVGRASEMARAAAKNQLDPVKVAEAAEKIRSTSLRISQIVSSLKSLARKDLGQTVFHPFPLARIVNEMTDLCAEKFRSQGVALEISPIPDTIKIEMDPTLISQLVLNLLNNAADAIEKESERWVKVDFTEDNDSVFLYVTDSGSGIPLKIRSRIFDPFFTTKDPGRGTGLGLSLSASIALHHNGVLHYDHLSAHTKFVLQLPKRNPNGKSALGQRAS